MLAALTDWYAVERGSKKVEYLAKPAATTLLVGVAATLDPTSASQRGWFAVALLFCLAGDVFLMLPRDMFVAGLASFLVGHLCFLAGLLAVGLHGRGVAATTIAVVVLVAVVARRVVPGARAHDPRLVVPVVVYIAVLSLLVALSGGVGSSLAIAGAGVFALSDSILSWNRFVRPFAHAHLATMVTYHAALALLAVSLAR